MSDAELKEQVRHFYDQIGWQVVSDDGLYQNARYEDLRPVSRAYIHRCHLRINRHLNSRGRFLLDAGSGPVQYPEYLTYSAYYDYRVCADISIVALKEARKRLEDRGLYVVADVANMPFKAEAFDGAVSLHTFHHLTASEQRKAYREINRVLAPEHTAVVVNGWTESRLMQRAQPLVLLMERLGKWWSSRKAPQVAPAVVEKKTEKKEEPVGTFIEKIDADWLKRELASVMDVDIRVWRSVSVRFLRAVVHRALGGQVFLAFLFWLEERFPTYFGRVGQYPLIVLHKRK